MRCLFAALAKENNVIIDKTDIVDKIYSFKNNCDTELMYMFEDIEFRASIDSVVSYDINEGINNLQTLGVAGKLNPTYEKIVIYLTQEEADEILQAYDSAIQVAMRDLAFSFAR
jgi:hypothetical protein